MTKFERVFRPLNQVESQRIPHLGVSLNVPGYVDQSILGFNVVRTQRMMRLGGIKNLKIVGTEGNISNHTPDIVGYNSSGEAYAGGRSTARRVPTYSSQMLWSENNTSKLSPSRWVDSTIMVNLSEISDRIADRNEQVRSAAAWSRELDLAI